MCCRKLYYGLNSVPAQIIVIPQISAKRLQGPSASNPQGFEGDGDEPKDRARSYSTFGLCAGSLCGALSYFYAGSAQQSDFSDEQVQKAPPGPDTTPPSERPPETPQQPSPAPVVCGPAHLGRCLKDLAQDQAGIWTSPLHIQSRDMFWLIPFAGATAAALHYDARAQEALGIDQSRINTSNRISSVGSPLATFGEGSALYLAGWLSHNAHLAETGRLGAEAVIDASLVTQAFKLATNRERPDEGNGRGGFWPHGTRQYSLNGSFPSGHTTTSWALARVIASEYPNPWTQVGVYAFATAISVARVTGRKHFPSDALVGSTFGYLIGGYVVHHRAAEHRDWGLPLSPFVDESTRTIGVRVELRPEDMNLAKMGRFVSRLHRSR